MRQFSINGSIFSLPLVIKHFPQLAAAAKELSIGQTVQFDGYVVIRVI